MYKSAQKKRPTSAVYIDKSAVVTAIETFLDEERDAMRSGDEEKRLECVRARVRAMELLYDNYDYASWMDVFDGFKRDR